ncbi:MAG TPA: hypothetical protein VFT95_13790 [Micromonosporaceae bacterium]|nr:hypothetical protein [Micromonosporaceae bacterium]
MAYAIRGNTTVVTVRGPVDSEFCRLLADGLEAARALRARGPIVVDLSGAGTLAAGAMICVARAAQDAARVGRELMVQF